MLLRLMMMNHEGSVGIIDLLCEFRGRKFCSSLFLFLRDLFGAGLD